MLQLLRVEKAWGLAGSVVSEARKQRVERKWSLAIKSQTLLLSDLLTLARLCILEALQPSNSHWESMSKQIDLWETSHIQSIAQPMLLSLLRRLDTHKLSLALRVS